MRPINLIPPEERRSHGSTTRTGPFAYVVVAALGVLLIGVVVLVLTSNQISDRESEVSNLEAQKTAAIEKADALTPYAKFQSLTEQRTKTISALADSRFDWPRVIRELSLILPPTVYLDGLTASAGGGSSTEGEAATVAGPSMQLEGCAPRQWVVAAFVSSLKGIDGVTRVGLKESKQSVSASGGAAGTVCEADGVYGFQIVVAFDAAPPSPDGTAAPTEEVEAAEGSSEASPESEGTEGSEPPAAGETGGTEETAASSTEATPVG